MHHHYRDIRERIAEAPTWFDEDGVPRYGPFSPSATADTYCTEAVLLEIACQACGHRFLVAMSHPAHVLYPEVRVHPGFAAELQSLHYGDPPNIGCCAAGPTMNCDDLRVVEFWRRDLATQWVRHPEYEVSLA